MYEYKYVEVVMDKGGLFSSQVPNYKEIIAEHAADGWRLVQIVEKDYNMDGRPWKFEAIFEKKN